jgi:general secretion pathway protein D
MRRFFALLFLAIMIGLAPAIFAAAPSGGGKENWVTMNFENVDIATLAKFISRITGKNFVLDDSVRGKVSVIAPAKVTPQQAYCIFETALQLKGFATVSAGPIIRIMPSRDARAFAAVTGSNSPAGVCDQPLGRGPS